MDLVVASFWSEPCWRWRPLWVAVRQEPCSQPFGAAVLLTLAIALLHFTAMGAVEITPDPSRTLSASSLSPIVARRRDHQPCGRRAQHEASSEHLRYRFQRTNAQLAMALTTMPQGLCMFDGAFQLVVCNDRYRAL